jgi:beta-galactosidase
MELGVAYYPEHHSPEQWRVDYRKIKDAGIKRIRIAEFAWSRLQSSDDEYHFEWLDQAIDMAAEYGLEVVLCTPTACPPIWLVERYPEVLPVNKSGKVVGFGARQHRSYHSPQYLSYSLRIVTRMAQRYGQHPNVVAWQLDNEFGGETKYDYGDCARRAFQCYLADKFITIEQLNERWGTVFWSQEYERWDQIPLPRPIDSDVMMWQHPSLELEFARFSSDSIVQYARKQTAILREYTGDRPITTNAFMFCWGDNVNWTDLFATLDVVGMDIYSNQPHEIAFYCDACRGVLSKPFWMMEYGSAAPDLDRDMKDIAARGCDQFFLFKLKPFPWGQEAGKGQPELLTLTGEPTPNYHIVQQYSELSHIAESATTALIDPSLEQEEASVKVGLYYDFECSWTYQTSVQDRLKYMNYMVHTVYKALHERSLPIDVIYTIEQINKVDVLIVALQVLHDAALEEALIAFVQGGGKLIVTSDLFRKNRDNVYLTVVPPIYQQVLNWQHNNFITDVSDERKVIECDPASGLGKAWVIARETSLEEWRELMESVLGE